MKYLEKRIRSEISVAEQEIRRIREEIKKEYEAVKDFSASFVETERAIAAIDFKKKKIQKHESILARLREELEDITD